jgi:hypothetical protein
LKTIHAVKHSTHYVTVCVLFTTVGFYFHINCTKGPVGTDEFLRLSLGRLWRNKFLQKQVELQIHKQNIFSNKPRCCNAKLFKSGGERRNSSRWSRRQLSSCITLLVDTQIKLRFKLQCKITGRCFVGNLKFVFYFVVSWSAGTGTL